MDFAVDLDKVLDEFEEKEDGIVTDNLLSATRGQVNSDFDLSDADFAPSSFSRLPTQYSAMTFNGEQTDLTVVDGLNHTNWAPAHVNGDPFVTKLDSTVYSSETDKQTVFDSVNSVPAEKCVVNHLHEMVSIMGKETVTSEAPACDNESDQVSENSSVIESDSSLQVDPNHEVKDDTANYSGVSSMISQLPEVTCNIAHSETSHVPKLSALPGKGDADMAHKSDSDIESSAAAVTSCISTDGVGTDLDEDAGNVVHTDQLDSQDDAYQPHSANFSQQSLIADNQTEVSTDGINSSVVEVEIAGKLELSVANDEMEATETESNLPVTVTASVPVVESVVDSCMAVDNVQRFLSDSGMRASLKDTEMQAGESSSELFADSEVSTGSSSEFTAESLELAVPSCSSADSPNFSSVLESGFSSVDPSSISVTGQEFGVTSDPQLNASSSYTSFESEKLEAVADQPQLPHLPTKTIEVAGPCAELPSSVDSDSLLDSFPQINEDQVCDVDMENPTSSEDHSTGGINAMLKSLEDCTATDEQVICWTAESEVVISGGKEVTINEEIMAVVDGFIAEDQVLMKDSETAEFTTGDGINDWLPHSGDHVEDTNSNGEANAYEPMEENKMVNGSSDCNVQSQPSEEHIDESSLPTSVPSLLPCHLAAVSDIEKQMPVLSAVSSTEMSLESTLNGECTDSHGEQSIDVATQSDLETVPSQHLNNSFQDAMLHSEQHSQLNSGEFQEQMECTVSQAIPADQLNAERGNVQGMASFPLLVDDGAAGVNSEPAPFVDACMDFESSEGDLASVEVDIDEIVRTSLGMCEMDSIEEQPVAEAGRLNEQPVSIQPPQPEPSRDPPDYYSVVDITMGIPAGAVPYAQPWHDQRRNEQLAQTNMPVTSSPYVPDRQPPPIAAMPGQWAPMSVNPAAAAAIPPSPALTHGVAPSRLVGPPMCVNMNIPITQLGKTKPVWLQDSEATKCMQCDTPFTFTKRRHHCRTCGKIFCSVCCSIKAPIYFLENKEARVCSICYQDLIRARNYEEHTQQVPESIAPNVAAARMPNPHVPSEYCSTVPPQSQVTSMATNAPPLAVMVPSGVLRKQGSVRSSMEPKQVMFSDGIRPGGDLTELDGVEAARSATLPAGRRTKASDKSRQNAAAKTRSLMQGRKKQLAALGENVLPPLVISSLDSEDFMTRENPPAEVVMEYVQNANSGKSAVFAINRNLLVSVQLVSLDCCMNRVCWCYSTKGLSVVGQDEIVILLERQEDDKTVPNDVFRHIEGLYDDAAQGNVISHLGHIVFSPGAFGNRDAGGYLFIRQSFQCLQHISVPEPPYLFAILLQKWELPWARVFPLRLMLRLGAEFRYYPSPLVSIRNRKPVYGEIGHTIMNLLADFHNFQYTVSQISGLLIHMEDKKTSVQIPRRRYEAIMKVISNSDDHVMALGASFSMAADSHLVCLQSDDGNYQTQAINIQNRPRRVTGASFIVFNGALKQSSGLRAKSSIIEDGLMVQITSEAMTALKQALRDMKDYVIECGSATTTQPDEFVVIEWITDESTANAGVKSPVDGRPMKGIGSIRVQTSTDYMADSGHVIRWTELYFISESQANSPGTVAAEEVRTPEDPADTSRLADHLAQAFCLALTPHLEALAFLMLMKIGLRVTVGVDQVGYEVGAGGARLPEFCIGDLDEKLIPIINGTASPRCGRSVVIELVFHILHPVATMSVAHASSSTGGSASSGGASNA